MQWGAGASIDFPVDPRQSCAFCGSQDWSTLLPLLSIPPWRAEASVGLPWFWVACTSCAGLVDAAHWDDLVERMDGADNDHRPSAREVLEAFRAFRSPPLRMTREEASAERPSLTATPLP